MNKNIKFLPPKTVTHLPTYEIFCKYMRLIYEENFDGEFPKLWYEYREATCKRSGDNNFHPNAYGSYGFYKDHGFKIITFEEFLEFQGLTEADIPKE